MGALVVPGQFAGGVARPVRDCAAAHLASCDRESGHGDGRRARSGGHGHSLPARRAEAVDRPPHAPRRAEGAPVPEPAAPVSDDAAGTLQITAAAPAPALLDLPWHLPPEDWPARYLAALPR